jgi:uncharacterized protein YsxB (DUF464 family)
MMRKLVCVAFALVAFTVVAFAEEYKGKLKSVDADKGTITVTIGDKDQEFKVPATAKITAGKKDIDNGLKKLGKKGVGAEVTVVTEKKDGAETVTTLRLQKNK